MNSEKIALINELRRRKIISRNKKHTWVEKDEIKKALLLGIVTASKMNIDQHDGTFLTEVIFEESSFVYVGEPLY